ncbi:hypothetical protein [Cellulosimicrobium marinum]|uniref:hypothetical protein n=1 Tax=Cellulosimicrobium marinum TaxID=1638992 RepID=UPI001E3E972B|nr:hypothetical protein [Cellulosimicrobium marinum]MCB7136581.1 hypothetical protein [Cellulosimicrobium marinum]
MGPGPVVPSLPRRGTEEPPDLARAVEHARILRGAGDPAGAARVLDRAFAAEGVRARSVSERVRFRALVLRADLALLLHDDASAARFLAGAEWFLAGAEFLPQVADALAALDEEVHRVEELRERLDVDPGAAGTDWPGDD